MASVSVYRFRNCPIQQFKTYFEKWLNNAFMMPLDGINGLQSSLSRKLRRTAAIRPYCPDVHTPVLVTKGSEKTFVEQRSTPIPSRACLTGLPGKAAGWETCAILSEMTG